MSQIWNPASNPALAAIHDVFTHLCDCALARASRAWRWHNPDRYRLRGLRQLACEAGLLNPASHRPTPLAAEWLYQPPAGQLATLAEAWIEQNETLARRQTFDRLAGLTPGARLSSAQLTNRTAERGQRSLWLPLVWLGYLIPEPDDAQPLALTVAAVPPPPAHFPDWEVDGLSIVVKPPYYWPNLWDLEHVAKLVAIGPPRRYVLTPGQWGRALARGFTASAALNLLERGTGAPLPAPVWEHFSPPQPAITVQSGALFTFTHGDDLKKLRQRFAWRRRLSWMLSPHHVWVSTAQAPLVVRALQRRGLTVQSDLLPASAKPASTANTDRLHLLLAAHVMQALARELDLPAPLDQPTLIALARHLPPAHQRRLERSIQLQLEHLRRCLPEPHALSPPQPSPDVRRSILTALEQGQALQLHYQPPAPRPLITRPVVPLRLETWGMHTYLLAHCLARHDLRTFRLDRITQAAPLDGAHTE